MSIIHVRLLNLKSQSCQVFLNLLNIEGILSGCVRGVPLIPLLLLLLFYHIHLLLVCVEDISEL